mgnify:CR=1 FL=1
MAPALTASAAGAGVTTEEANRRRCSPDSKFACAPDSASPLGAAGGGDHLPVASRRTSGPRPGCCSTVGEAPGQRRQAFCRARRITRPRSGSAGRVRGWGPDSVRRWSTDARHATGDRACFPDGRSTSATTTASPTASCGRSATHSWLVHLDGRIGHRGEQRALAAILPVLKWRRSVVTDQPQMLLSRLLRERARPGRVLPLHRSVADAPGPARPVVEGTWPAVLGAIE